jgi:predicted outer membrane protein
MTKEEEAEVSRKMQEEYLRQMKFAKEQTMGSIRRYLLSNLSDEELKKFAENLTSKESDKL